MSKIAILKKSDLVKVGSQLSTEQINFLLQKTPPSQIKKRKAKGGGEWSYVTGAYMKKVLSMMFGFDWDFIIVKDEYDLTIGQAFVHGRLVCRLRDPETKEIITTITKEQFGRVDIKFKNEWVDGKKVKSSIPLDLGNDMKAAATDALKKCASELGVASDVYAADEYKEVFVYEDMVDDTDKLTKIKELLSHPKSEAILSEEDKMNIERIIDTEEVSSYDKVIKTLIKITK